MVVVGGVAPSGASAGRKEGDGGVSAACAVTMTSLGVVMVVDIVFVCTGAGVCEKVVLKIQYYGPEIGAFEAG